MQSYNLQALLIKNQSLKKLQSKGGNQIEISDGNSIDVIKILRFIRDIFKDKI